MWCHNASLHASLRFNRSFLKLRGHFPANWQKHARFSPAYIKYAVTSCTFSKWDKVYNHCHLHPNFDDNTNILNRTDHFFLLGGKHNLLQVDMCAVRAKNCSSWLPSCNKSNRNSSSPRLLVEETKQKVLNLSILDKNDILKTEIWREWHPISTSTTVISKPIPFFNFNLYQTTLVNIWLENVFFNDVLPVPANCSWPQKFKVSTIQKCSVIDCFNDKSKLSLGMTAKLNRQLTRGSVGFQPVSIVLNNNNCPEPQVNRCLSYEVAPKHLKVCACFICISLFIPNCL